MTEKTPQWVRDLLNETRHTDAGLDPGLQGIAQRDFDKKFSLRGQACREGAGRTREEAGRIGDLLTAPLPRMD